MSSSGDTNWQFGGRVSIKLDRTNSYLWCDDFWVEILKRLPVPIICELRRVCKSWYSLISSSFFTNQHYSFNINLCINNNNNTSYLNIGYDRFYSLYTPQEDDELAQLPKWRVPFQSRNNYELIDVNHGVVCLSPGAAYSTAPTILWNPTIHKYVEIPCSTTPQQGVAGFGFDPSKNEFKVVRYIYSALHPKIILEVLSTREGLWRKVNSDHIGPFSFYDSIGRSKDSAIHWMIKRYTEGEEGNWSLALLVFDCEREELKAVYMPQEIKEHGWGISPWLFVSNTSGRISVLAITRAMEKGKELEEWVMEEYGLWKKLRMRDQQDILRIEKCGVLQLHVFMHNGHGWPLVDGGIIFKRSHHLFNAFLFQPSLYLLDASSYYNV